jgi:hypothetical protein
MDHRVLATEGLVGESGSLERFAFANRVHTIAEIGELGGYTCRRPDR